MVTARVSPRSASRRAALPLPVAAGAVFLLMAPYAAASTGIGTATIAPPGATAGTPLLSGEASTPFTVALPPNAACPGDTAHHGDHVYSYLVPAGTDLAAVTFIVTPSTGYGLVDAAGRYYGAVNTAEGTGQIIGIPNDFEWGPLVTAGDVPLSTLLHGPTRGVWDAGLACADAHGVLTDAWNTRVTFTAGTTAAHGFTWAAAPGGGSDRAGSGSATVPVPPTLPKVGGPVVTPGGSPGGTAVSGGHPLRTPAGPGAAHGSDRSGGSAGTGATGVTGGDAGSPGTDDAPVGIAVGAAIVVVVAAVVLAVRRRARSGGAPTHGDRS